MQAVNKKNVFLWALYDYANSISTVVFFLYFSQWLVVDYQVSDLWFNLIFVGSTLALLFTAPVAGNIADKADLHMPFLKIVTVFQYLSLLMASALAVYADNFQLVVIVVLLYLLSNYFYMFSFTFYNSLLGKIAPARYQGLISGVGQSANWLGQISGLVLTLPFALGLIVLFGNPGRVQTFLPAALMAFLLSLPMLLFFKERSDLKLPKTNLKAEYINAYHAFLELFKTPGLGRFLLGYFLFNDAMVTAINNMPIYLEQVFRVSDAQKAVLIMAGLATSAIGAVLVGWISDQIGLKKTLLIILSSWLVVFPTLAMVTEFNLLVIMITIVGFLFGGTWTVTRAVMTYLSPRSQLSHAFTYYTVAERFSTFIGPLSWGLITSLLYHTGDFRYRVALISMTIFIFLGLWIVRKIPVKEVV